MKARHQFLLLGILSLSGVQDVVSQDAELGQGLSVDETLRALTSGGAKGDSQVNLLLRSGARLDGVLSSCENSKSTCLLVGRDGATTVIDTSQITSVTIVNPGSALVALQGNKIYRNKQAAPTVLEFRRQLELLRSGSPAITTALSEQELSSDDCRFYSKTLLEALQQELKLVLGDAMGAEAISKKGGKIAVVSKKGAALAVRGAGSQLELEFDCAAPLDHDYRSTLATGLSDAL